MTIALWDESHYEIQIKKHPWMDTKQFILGTVDNLAQIVDECITSKRFAIDLETSGLDNRVFNGKTRDIIAGVCLSPDGVKGYYIPLNHVEDKGGVRVARETNIPRTIFDKEFYRLMAAVDAGQTIATFHNAKFDQEFLEFNGGKPYGEWDKVATWDDTVILAALRNSRARNQKLKDMAAAPVDAPAESSTGGPGLGMEMVELYELFGHDKEQRNFRYDFTTLDPTEKACLTYACSDAICTWLLYQRLIESPGLLVKDQWGFDQNSVYRFEKGCLTATRWMERNRIFINQKTVMELIKLGQTEWSEAVNTVYTEASGILGRNIMPGYYKYLLKHFVADPSCKACQGGGNPSCSQCGGKGFDPSNLIEAQIERAKTEAKNAFNVRDYGDPWGMHQDGATSWPMIYDINAPQQLGGMFEEMKVPGLQRTEASGQIKTSKDEIDRIVEEAGDEFPFMGKIKRFREVNKALSSYLYAFLRDADPDDNSIRIGFRANKVDTGRFSTPAKDAARANIAGMPSVNFQAIPRYDPSGKNRPVCMGRLRECIVPRRKGRKVVSIDFSGEELRIISNLSLEPKWLKEFFHCAECDRMFPQGDGQTTPEPPPPFCPNCGSDKIGDLHTLTGLEVYGADARNKPDWKELRNRSKCVHPDSIICTDGKVHRIGLLPSEEDKFLSVKVKNAWVGDHYETLRETYGGGEKPLYHIITRRGVLTCSAEHRVALFNGSLASISSGLSKGTLLPEPATQKILTDSFWPVIHHKVFDGVPEMGIPTNKSLAYLAGAILGDGTKSVSSCAITHGAVGKQDDLGVPFVQWQEILMEACRAAGFDPVPRTDHVYLGSRHVIRFLAALQIYSLPEETWGTRRLLIPDWIWEAGPQALYPFLGGLFDTDGSVSAKDKNLAVTTKDPLFAGHIATALQVLGMQVSVETCWNKTYERWYFRVKIFRENSVAFIPYMKHPGKVQRLQAVGGVDKPQCGRRKPNEVLLIQEAGKLPCMDLHIDSTDHLYWVNGFITHNSLNFAMSYGGGGSAAQRAVGCSKQEGARIKGQFDSTYGVLQKWWKSQHALAKQRGYVFTPFNRKYPVPDIHNPDGFFRSKAERNSVNGPVQSCGADICKIAMALLFKEMKKRSWLDRVQMIATMHDELVFEIDEEILEEAIQIIVPLMCRNPIILAQRWPIPLTCDVEFGDDWSVAYHLEKCKHGKNENKKTKEKYGFPPEIAHLFPNKGLAPGAIQVAPAPVEQTTPVAETSPVRVEAETQTPTAVAQVPTSAPAEAPSNGVSKHTQDPSKLNKGDFYDFRLAVPLTMDNALRLAEIIQKSRGRGTRILRLFSAKGESLDAWLEYGNNGQPILISDVVFYGLAVDRGLAL